MTAYLECPVCDRGYVEAMESVGGRDIASGALSTCPSCRGTCTTDCFACGKAPAVVAVDRTPLCGRCADDCARIEAEFHLSTMPPAPDTVPDLDAIAGDDELCCDDVRTALLVAALSESIELAQDCRAAGIPVHEGFRIVRGAHARMAGNAR